MKINIFCFFTIVFLSTHAAQASAELLAAAPTQLPGVERPMKAAGFWVSRHPAADKVVLTPAEIKEFNASVQKDLKLTKDILQILAPFSGKALKATLEKTLQDLQGKKYYAGPVKAEKNFFNEVRANMNLAAIPEEVQPQFGFVVRFADQRFLPTLQGLSEKPDDADFDELQNSDLDVGTPVVILQHSADHKWYYVLSELLDGWVDAEQVALARRPDIEDFFSAENFAVITVAKADIFSDLEQTQYHDYVRMGVRLPIEQIFDNGVVEVRIPVRSSDGILSFEAGYIKEKDLHQGYLPYTPRHMIEQAFALLYEPYGWGGMHGEQDCSRFLQEIFATVGISLPRNSSQQAEVGRRLAQFNEKSTEKKDWKRCVRRPEALRSCRCPDTLCCFWEWPTASPMPFMRRGRIVKRRETRK